MHLTLSNYEKSSCVPSYTFFFLMNKFKAKTTFLNHVLDALWERVLALRFTTTGVKLANWLAESKQLLLATPVS